MSAAEDLPTEAPAVPRSGAASGAGSPRSLAVQPVRILLALGDGLCPTTSLRRVTTLARALRAEVRVLQVVPAPSDVRPLLLRRGLAGIVGSVERTLAADRVTRPWLEGVLGDGMPAAQFRVREGDFVDKVAAYSADMNASLIVTPPQSSAFGATVAELALASNLPVLVAREAAPHGAIVAGTDLEDLDYPVLRQAADLARRLQASVVAVHNIKPMEAFSGVDLTWSIDMLPWETGFDQGTNQLIDAADALVVEAVAIVRSEVNPTAAILDEVQKRDADLVVVGTRPHSWLERLLGDTVAVQVVDGARRSVLVIPLGKRDPFENDPGGLA